jgi:hypothetical protein
MIFPGRRAGPDCGAASYDCSTHPVPHHASPLGRPPGTIVQAVIRPALPIAAGVRRMGFSFAGPGPLRENEGGGVSVMLGGAPGGGQAPAARTWRGSNSRSTESRFCRSAASRRPKVFSRSCRSQASASRESHLRCSRSGRSLRSRPSRIRENPGLLRPPISPHLPHPGGFSGAHILYLGVDESV